MKSSPSQNPGRDGGHVLMVEDEEPNRFLVRRALATLGCRITECPTGTEAQRLAREILPDVALVDVRLPDVDGFEVCRRIQTDPVTADIPVIIITSRSGIDDVERGFEAGALDYIRKPYNPRELAVRVRNAVELKRRGDKLRKWKDRTSRELSLASVLQQTILAPKPFLHELLRVHPAYQPSTEVGGDFFDVVPLPDSRIALYVGDVAGHGVGPAMVAALLKASLAELLPAFASHGPARVCNELHERFIRQINLPSLFATLYLAVGDLVTRRWQYLSCGHPAPIVADTGGFHRSDIDQKGGPAIGLSLLPKSPFSRDDEVMVMAPEGAVMLFVTDGMLEALSMDRRDESGRKLVADLLNEWVRDGSESAVEYVFRRMKECGYAMERDDCTALAVEHVATSEIILNEIWMLSHDALQKISSAAESALRNSGWPDSAAWAVGLLILEHGANVIGHGDAAPASRYAVQLRLRSAFCELLIRDSGLPWTYEGTPIEPPPRAESGRGIFMMRRIASRIETCRHDDENVTVFTVRKDWKPES